MAKPALPRQFTFDLPLFHGGPPSPWVQLADPLKPKEISILQAWSTYHILRRFSAQQLQNDRHERDRLLAAGKQTSDRFKELNGRIPDRERHLAGGGGGAAQFPQVNYKEYAFPIYPARRIDNALITQNVLMRAYDGSSFEPPWFPRGSDVDGGWTARDVPIPAGPFEPGAPASNESDGNIIVYDASMQTEYDFWQVRKDPADADKPIASAGSVSMHALKGAGARRPAVEPCASSRATGLPYLGGLILPEDVAGNDDLIPHALAFGLPQLRYFPGRPDACAANWVYPATSTETMHGIADRYALAAGQRIVLRPVLHARDGKTRNTQALIDDRAVPLIVRMFLKTLLTYGAFVVDGAAGFSFAAEDILTADHPHLDASRALALTGAPLPDKQTPWEAVIETLNENLSWKLLDGSGLAFGWWSDDLGFLPNFDVAEDIEPFYDTAC